MSIDVEAPTVGEDEATAGGGRRRVVVVVLVLALVAGAAWWLLRPSADAEDGPAPGEVVTLESVQVNLADGHFLRIGLALQLVEGVEEIDGSQALDTTIELFSGRAMDDLAVGRKRSQLKEALLARLEMRYDHDVMALYFTEFVMQ